MSGYSETMYPNVILGEAGLHVRAKDNSFFIPGEWVEASPALRSERGFFHRVTLTLFVNEITIESGVEFR